MRFRQKRSNDEVPDVNLVPMMDVLMTVLTFFIIISMTLTGQQIANVTIPKTDGAGLKVKPEDKPSLLVGLTADNRIVVDEKTANTAQLAEAMQQFYGEHPDGVVLLKADRQLDFSKVTALLKTMRDIGGDRVSLSIERGDAAAD